MPYEHYAHSTVNGFRCPSCSCSNHDRILVQPFFRQNSANTHTLGVVITIHIRIDFHSLLFVFSTVFSVVASTSSALSALLWSAEIAGSGCFFLPFYR
jgi:hypothetical protein